jgi:hypothetical protein
MRELKAMPAPTATLHQVKGAAISVDPNTARNEAQRARLKSSWPDEFRDGERCAFLRKFKGKRESGGFPLGFHTWPLERKNSWYCGYNIGLIERQRALVEMEAADADG